MSGRTPSYSSLTNTVGRDSLPVFPLTISVRRDSCGAIPSTTGTPCARQVIGGRLIECAPCSLTWMQSDWITSAASPPHGTFQRVQQRPSQDNGYRGPEHSFSKQCATSSATCPSSSKIWELLLRMYRHCVTNFDYPGRGFCSSPSMAIQITPTYQTTLSRTLSLTPGPMTTRQLESGTQNYPITSGRTSGAILGERRLKNPKLLRH